MPLTTDEIEERFGFHPGTDVTRPMHKRTREAYKAFATFLNDLLPDGRAKSTAMTNLQQSAMWANYGVALLAPVETPPRPPVTAKPGPPPSTALLMPTSKE